MTCLNCHRPIAAKWIRKVWYHLDTGREQCNYEDLYDINIATPWPPTPPPYVQPAEP
jgi:hypothetical protein